jgi:hypothetical protein
MNKKAVQMFATPAECILKDFVEFGETGCADHEQSPPHQRTHAAEHYAKLINRNGRYRRFRHANSLSKRKPTVLNLMTPGIFRSPRQLVLTYLGILSGVLLGKTAASYAWRFSPGVGNIVEGVATFALNQGQGWLIVLLLEKGLYTKAEIKASGIGNLKKEAADMKKWARATLVPLAAWVFSAARRARVPSFGSVIILKLSAPALAGL